MFEAILAGAYLGVQFMDGVPEFDKERCVQALLVTIGGMGVTYIVGVANRPELDD